MHKPIICLLLLAAAAHSYADDHSGVFIRFSIGTGLYSERSLLHESGLTTPAKNHAIGWAFHRTYAVHISDFGGLIKNSVGEYKYINLDALGLGITRYFPRNIFLTLSGACGKVTLAPNWYEITDAGLEEGFALNLSLNKEWFFARRWSFLVGAQGFYFRTADVAYEFFHVGITCGITHYFTPIG